MRHAEVHTQLHMSRKQGWSLSLYLTDLTATTADIQQVMPSMGHPARVSQDEQFAW